MRKDYRKQDKKILIYSIAGIGVLLITVAGLLIYGGNLDEEAKKSQINSDQIASMLNEEQEKATESASSSLGKTVEEGEKAKQEELNKTNTTSTAQNSTINNNDLNKKTEQSTTKAKTNNKTATTSSAKSVEKNKEDKAQENNTKEETKKELVFQKPLEGEIMHEFAKENLIYSETLQEWVTHNGIDIKAEKATVVQSAEDGTVKSIKNDPRYGLTIVIEHEDGFQTIYANLLSSEFVNIGDKVIKGQSIGTVGNTAAFESADEPHLHFEILKDSIQVDPSIYLK